MIRVTSFCCCCDLRVAAVIIGVFQFIANMILIISLSIVFSSGELREMILRLTNGTIEFNDFKWIVGLPLLFSAMYVVLAVLLIWGTFRNNQKFVIMYLIANGFAIVLEFFTYWIDVILLFINVGITEGVINMVCLNTFIVVNIYFWVVIYNLWEEMLTEDERLKMELEKIDAGKIDDNYSNKPTIVQPKPENSDDYNAIEPDYSMGTFGFSHESTKFDTQYEQHEPHAQP